LIFIEFEVCFALFVDAGRKIMKKKQLSILVLFACALAVQAAGADNLDNPAAPAQTKPKAHHKVRQLSVKSHIALIYDEQAQRPLYNKHSDTVVPIASITKLMTAMVMLDAQLPMDQEVSVEDDDLNRIRRAKSRLRVGMTLTRSEMLKLALMASENRAALALARSYPGGPQAMVAAMNAKAQVLGMQNTRFFDPTGLDSDNVSTAQDLVKMVAAARRYPLIHQYTTSSSHSVEGLKGRTMRFSNTNPLVRNASWDIGVSKTGYISEAGLCLVMEATIKQRPVIIVLLDSWGKHTRVGDANRIRNWMESLNAMNTSVAGNSFE
jgi:serine-type D-Ala-D-Ala endopeptidase (penicillin-binding protein 7)